MANSRRHAGVYERAQASDYVRKQKYDKISFTDILLMFVAGSLFAGLVWFLVYLIERE